MSTCEPSIYGSPRENVEHIKYHCHPARSWSTPSWCLLRKQKLTSILAQVKPELERQVHTLPSQAQIVDPCQAVTFLCFLPLWFIPVLITLGGCSIQKLNQFSFCFKVKILQGLSNNSYIFDLTPGANALFCIDLERHLVNKTCAKPQMKAWSLCSKLY